VGGRLDVGFSVEPSAEGALSKMVINAIDLGTLDRAIALAEQAADLALYLGDHNLRAENLLHNVVNNKPWAIDFVRTNSVQAKSAARFLDDVGVNLIEWLREMHPQLRRRGYQHHRRQGPVTRR
jgi:hypothetical protein